MVMVKVSVFPTQPLTVGVTIKVVLTGTLDVLAVKLKLPIPVVAPFPTNVSLAVQI